MKQKLLMLLFIVMPCLFSIRTVCAIDNTVDFLNNDQDENVEINETIIENNQTSEKSSEKDKIKNEPQNDDDKKSLVEDESQLLPISNEYNLKGDNNTDINNVDIKEENYNYGLKCIEDGCYYFDENGIIQTGIIRDKNDNLYFFDEDTGKMQTGWIFYNGNTYYADIETGVLKRLINEIDGKSYFFGRTGAALQKGFIEFYGDYYLTDNDGVLQSGIQNVNNNAYIFDSETKKALTGWISYNDNTYYADLNTKRLYNLIHEIDGNLYFFGRTQYRILKDWIFYNGNTYYADIETGVLKRLINEIDGKSYFFGRTGAALQKGFIEFYGDYYLTDNDGVLQSGIQNVNNNAYIFDSETKKALTGWISYNDNTYYADLNTKRLYNLIHEIDGKGYFFGRTQYRVLKDWIQYNGCTYYGKLDTGELVKGIYTIDNIEYNFDYGYKLQSGWINNNGSTYYLYSDLTYAKGVQKIGSSRYMFDSNGALMYSNVKLYLDISSHQGNIDFDMLWNSGQIDGIILRAGYWDSEDKYFKYYIQEIKRLGIPYTVYLYSYAHDENEALIEAQNMLDIIRRYNLNPSLSVYYDLEGYDTGVQNSNDISKDGYQRIAQNFINFLGQNGYNAKIYSYYYFALNRFDEVTRNYLDWIAKYSETNNYPYSWRGWQFTDIGRVPGISTNVDMSIFLY